MPRAPLAVGEADEALRAELELAPDGALLVTVHTSSGAARARLTDAVPARLLRALAAVVTGGAERAELDFQRGELRLHAVPNVARKRPSPPEPPSAEVLARLLRHHRSARPPRGR